MYTGGTQRRHGILQQGHRTYIRSTARTRKVMGKRRKVVVVIERKRGGPNLSRTHRYIGTFVLVIRF